ncbi:hypothetical protein V6N11_072398 [Hibiscus sabdariffa]|uniref:GRAM domain-containing protein n=1 Tax=Hibiscus sabdariffa TaxID=183260 RepID=A0ABR2U3Q2_9ROSI
MKNQILDQMIGVPVKSTMYQVERASRLYLQDAAGQYWIPSSAEDKGNFALKRMNKLGKKADAFIHGVHEHVKLVPKITKTVKGKLSLGARILQVGGDRSIKIPSPNGEFLIVHYKVLIPLEKIKGVNESENMKKPSQKYMEIVTVDGFDFWFMGFLNHQKTFKYLQQEISQRLLDYHARFHHFRQLNGAAARGLSGKSAKQPPKHSAAPPGLGMYGAPTIRQHEVLFSQQLASQ